MRILMVGGGEKPSIELFEKYKNMCDYSIAIDSGLDLFLEFESNVDFVVGDFDSTRLTKEEIEKFNFVKFPAEKDYTDSELGLEKAIELGTDEIYLLGMTGGRLDHFMGNLGLLKKSLDRGIKAFLIDEKNFITMIDKPIDVDNIGKKYISFYAYGGEVSELTLKGSKYELNKYNLKPFEGICNSNEFKSDRINVNFKNGTLIIIYSQD